MQQVNIRLSKKSLSPLLARVRRYVDATETLTDAEVIKFALAQFVTLQEEAVEIADEKLELEIGKALEDIREGRFVVVDPGEDPIEALDRYADKLRKQGEL
jgi:hypothetical protein